MADEDRYRAAPVRDARARAERAKRGELAEAVGDARAASARLDALRTSEHRAREKLAAAIAACERETTAAGRTLGERFVARRRRELAAAADEVVRAEAAHAARTGAVDAAQRALARARADRELIERHFARWRDDRRKLAERRED